MACLRLVTFLPLRPLFSFPLSMARTSRSTNFPAAGEYLRVGFPLAGAAYNYQFTFKDTEQLARVGINYRF